MNRLVLIGNGFDLAHGLKTSYKDFIDWYWRKCGERLLHEYYDVVSDELCSFILKTDIVSSWYLVWTGHYYKRKDPTIPWDVNDVVNLAMNDGKLCDFTITSPLLQRICKHLAYGWVDIENEYYSLLLQRISMIKPYTEQNIKNLNIQLNTLRDYLINYLRTEEEKGTEIKEEIMDKIYRPIMKDEIAVTNQKFSGNRLGDSAPSSIMLLNFNYTKTPELYLTDPSVVRVNYIHGKLDNPQSVIFGYGDELAEDYKKLQELNENEVLRHIKSIRYLESDSYRKVLDFIESGSFQICIMGHSCGNSDRTLLNTIFEHKNCISIKPYFYKMEDGSDNYIEIIQNISRNFKDMKLMRDRVVNKLYCETLAQD